MGREYWDFWNPPDTLFKQKFGDLIDDKEIESRFRSRFADLSLDSPLRRDFLVRGSPFFHQEMESTGISSVKNDANSFQIFLDVSQFKAEEVNVKTTNSEVIVHAKHDEREDEHGFVSREFKRRYLLPLGVDPDKVACFIDGKGILAIKAPKDGAEKTTPKSAATNAASTASTSGKETLIRIHKDEKVVSEQKSRREETMRTSSAASSTSSSSSSSTTKTTKSMTSRPQVATQASTSSSSTSTYGKKSPPNPPLMTDVWSTNIYAGEKKVLIACCCST